MRKISLTSESSLRHFGHVPVPEAAGLASHFPLALGAKQPSVFSEVSPFRCSFLEKCFRLAWGVTLNFLMAWEAAGSGGAGQKSTSSADFVLLSKKAALQQYFTNPYIGRLGNQQVL